MKPSDELNPFQTIIDEFYQVFDYPKPTGFLNVCTCGVCVDEKLELEMRTLPLRELTQIHLYEYVSSVKDKIERPNELKYFLPRMVELFTKGENLHHSTEIYFERVGNCPKGSFTTQEMALWNKFCYEYLKTLLNVYPYECLKWKQDCVFSCLLMFHIGGADIQPFLDYWATQETPQSTINYVFDTGYGYLTNYYSQSVEYELNMAFAQDCPEFEPMIENWLANPKHKQHFSNCIANLNSDDIDKFYAEYDFVKEMDYVSCVFDALTGVTWN